MGCEQILLARNEMLNLFRKSQSEPEDPNRFLIEHAKRINGSLCVFGDWFGRPMDNWHQLVSHETKQGYARLTFNEGETLDVWEPIGLRMDAKSFIIQRAVRVRWEWFYYGRPKSPENRFFIEHILSDQGIEVASNANWAPHDFKPLRSEPAVSIT